LSQFFVEKRRESKPCRKTANQRIEEKYLTDKNEKVKQSRDYISVIRKKAIRNLPWERAGTSKNRGAALVRLQEFFSRKKN